MTSEPEKDISRILHDGQPIDDALNAAAREAVRQHKQQGQPLVISRNGQPVLISPDEVEEVQARE